MWREYTRETPAKPGWAIASTGAALVLTTGLAWVLAHQGVPSTTLGGTITPPYWPISISLPAGAAPLRKWNGKTLGVDFNGNIGVLAFQLPRANGGDGPQILVYYKVCEDEADLQDERFDFSGEDFKETESIDMGPMEARMLKGYLPTHELLISAVGVLEEGLVIRFQMICPPDFRGAERLFRTISASVEFRDWFIPRFTDLYDGYPVFRQGNPQT